VNDAVRLTYRMAGMAAAMRKQTLERPKGGARWHFSLPGSVQGWVSEDSAESRGAALVSNSAGKLRVGFERLSGGRVARVGSAVFVTPEQAGMAGYSVYACPQLVPGQRVRVKAELESATGGVKARVYARRYGVDDAVEREAGAWKELRSGQQVELELVVPETDGTPYMDVGVEVAATQETAVSGALLVDHVAVEGEPTVVYRVPGNVKDGWDAKNRMYRRQWVDGVDAFHPGWFPGGELFRIAHDTPGGMIITGNEDWKDYSVSTQVYVHMGDRALVCARVGGMKRYYALVLEKGGKVRLVKNVNGRESVLAEAALHWKLHQNYAMELTVKGDRLVGKVGGVTLEARDGDLKSGGIALGVDTGRINIFPVQVKPA
jgi:hypothetical protein